MSSSRSRRLVTGYLLGNPHGSEPHSPNTNPEVHIRNPTPPEENDTYHSGPLDSPPVSVAQDDEDEATSTIQKLAQMRIQGKKPRQDSNIRDKETGYDRLNGLNDGEADLDESAPQAEGDGSEAYLRGVEGPSGEYHFPTHRLRTTMKGELMVGLIKAYWLIGR
jgi:nicotinamide mononucleotide adenylyltransferase